MKIYIKKYELCFVIALASLVIIKYSFQAIGFISTNVSGFEHYLHLNSKVNFDFVTNLFFARTGIILLLLLLYFWINFSLIPWFLRTKTTSFFKYFIVFTQIIIISYIVAIGFNIASYFGNPAWNNYGEFFLFSLFGYNEKPLTNLWMGFGNAIILVSIYMFFVFIREFLIYKIGNSLINLAYKIYFINKIFLAFYIFFLLPVFLPAIYDLGNNDFFRAYFLIFLPSIIVYFTNIYWLFPSLSNSSRSIFIFIFRLLVSTLIFSFPLFAYWEHYGVIPKIWSLNWIVQLLIVTPISWLLYKFNKEKIHQLKGTEAALSKSTADLLFLRSQINPHFLFNALNTLYSTALIDGSKRTANGIQMLGDMMRFMLDDNHLDYISLEKEINYIKNFIALQKMRVSDPNLLMVRDNIDVIDCRYQIVPMLLIPLIENAFKHGIDVNKKSWIVIDLICDADVIKLIVRNSLHQMEINDPEKKHSGIGLRNVKERLLLFYKERHNLFLSSTNEEFIAELIIQP